jgi:tripartite-type tricarboxylate transporter receptor subunit TctC
MNFLTSRRRLLIGAAGIAVAAMAPSLGLAEDSYPDRPVRFLIGFPPGGNADTVARILAEEFSNTFGEQFIVESKPGASGNIATQVVVGAPADGYTIYLAQINLATNPFIMEVGYDPKTDLQMISQAISIPVVMLTNPASGLKTVQEVVAAAKAGSLKFGGVLGTSSHLAPSLFALDQGIEFKFIPYKGGALAVQALLSGEVDVVFDLMSGTNEGLIEGGKLNAVAVMQDTPVKGLENIPPASEAGVSPAGFFRSWSGIAVKAGTPPEIVDKLFVATTEALKKPEVRQRLEQLGNEVVVSESPEAFQAMYVEEIDRLGALLDTIGYKPQ